MVLWLDLLEIVEACELSGGCGAGRYETLALRALAFLCP